MTRGQIELILQGKENSCRGYSTRKCWHLKLLEFVISRSSVRTRLPALDLTCVTLGSYAFGLAMLIPRSWRSLAVFHVPNLVVDASRCPAKLLHASNRRREKMTSPGLCAKASKSTARGDQGSSVRKSAWIGDGDGVVEW